VLHQGGILHSTVKKQEDVKLECHTVPHRSLLQTPPLSVRHIGTGRGMHSTRQRERSPYPHHGTLWRDWFLPRGGSRTMDVNFVVVSGGVVKVHTYCNTRATSYVRMCRWRVVCVKGPSCIRSRPRPGASTERYVETQCEKMARRPASQYNNPSSMITRQRSHHVFHTLSRRSRM